MYICIWVYTNVSLLPLFFLKLWQRAVVGVVVVFVVVVQSGRRASTCWRSVSREVQWRWWTVLRSSAAKSQPSWPVSDLQENCCTQSWGPSVTAHIHVLHTRVSDSPAALLTPVTHYHRLFVEFLPTLCRHGDWLVERWRAVGCGRQQVARLALVLLQRQALQHTGRPAQALHLQAPGQRRCAVNRAHRVLEVLVHVHWCNLHKWWTMWNLENTMLDVHVCECDYVVVFKILKSRAYEMKILWWFGANTCRSAVRATCTSRCRCTV